MRKHTLALHPPCVVVIMWYGTDGYFFNMSRQHGIQIYSWIKKIYIESMSKDVKMLVLCPGWNTLSLTAGMILYSPMIFFISILLNYILFAFSNELCWRCCWRPLTQAYDPDLMSCLLWSARFSIANQILTESPAHPKVLFWRVFRSKMLFILSLSKFPNPC